jgi:hypothetical protein
LPGSRLGNDDLQVPKDELSLFLDRPVVVVEKLDGVALTIGLQDDVVDVTMKPDWQTALGGAMFNSARRWVRAHDDLLAPLVADGRQLYAEWLHHRLVTRYSRLPAAVMVSGIRDRRGLLWGRAQVNAAARRQGLAASDPVFAGVIGSAARLRALVPKRSKFGDERPEGIIVEAQHNGSARWAKWVAPHYVQPRGKTVKLAFNQVVEDA